MQSETLSPLVAERQRRTWAAIHDAAASQALEHGIDAVTVARIAELAGVSPRTFFNYFDSKEDAIVGVRAPRIDDAIVAELADSTDEVPLMRVARLVALVAFSTVGPDVDLPRRRRLAHQYPSLRSRLTQVFTEARKEVVAQFVDDVPVPWRGATGLPTDPDEARALVMLAGAVVTFAWSRDPDRMYSDTDDALADAITTFRKVTTSAL